MKSDSQPVRAVPQSLEFRQPRGRPDRAWVTVAIGLALGAVLGAGCERAGGPAAPPTPEVVVITVAATNVPLTAEFIGQLDSPQNVEVRARVEAFVDKVLFEEGRPVKRDQPLFELDKKPFQQRLLAAEGVLAEARASLKKYEADVARLRPLAEKRAIPRQDLDNAVASVEVGKAAVLSAEAQVESAKLDLGYCDVTAPVDGLIGAKQVAVGSLVGKGQPTLLATISTLNPIWFYCSLSEVDYMNAERRVRETGRRFGDVPLTLILANGAEHPAPGQWIFLDRAVDTTTGTIRARAEFSNPDGVLRPGMFARVRLHLKTDKESLLIPQRALLELQGKFFVWVIDAEDKASQRPVTPGPAHGSDVVVVEGLKAGDRVVIEGLQKAWQGAAVKPLTPEQAAQAAADAAPVHAAKGSEGQPGKH